MKIFLLLALAAAPAYSAITVVPSTLGNLFLTTEPVSIPVTSAGPITWTVNDYWGIAIAAGSGSPVQPGIAAPGWYSVEIHDGASVLTTSFAIVAPFTVSETSRFGVHAHFSQGMSRSYIPLAAKAGISHIRDEHYWASTENPKGTYVWPAKFTTYLADAATYGIAPFLPLTWANQFYDYDTGVYTGPYTDAGRLGYANFAKAVLDHYGGGNQIKAVEGWNEYNAGTFITGPATTNKKLYYKLMMQKVWEVIKPAHPNVKVVAGAAVPFSHGFFRDIIGQGILPYCDALSVHPYRIYPDGVDLAFSELKAMAPAKELWATEFSLSAANDSDRMVEASYVAQMVALMLSQDVKRMYYYLVGDYGSFAYRGLFGVPTDARGGFRPHPASISYATAARQYDGAVFDSRLSAGVGIYAFKFTKGSQPLYVLWSNRPTQISMQASGPVTVVDMMGGTSVKPAGVVTLALTKDVHYVVGAISSISAVNHDLLADSLSGQGKVAGYEGWSYGISPVLSASAPWDPAAFTPMTWAIYGTEDYRWLMLPSGTPFGNGALLHPSSRWAIRRWVSPISGRVKLTGDIYRASTSGDGVGLRIFVDGAEVYNVRIMPGQNTTYAVPDVAVNIGSKVDFTINSWIESSYDATNFTSQVISLSPNAPTGLRIVP